MSTLRFFQRSKTNRTQFEAHYGRKADTVLRNLTKRPILKNLNWNKEKNQKLSFLDERSGRANDDPFRIEDWDKRSGLTLTPQNRRGLRMLSEKELTEKDVELHNPSRITA